ncbi:dual specificity protein phosphatase 12 [Ascodesmis nigricans]|uniref:protein-tyrosine-phosphatase n=1 Tax=Ascodesmis nigricans TaxID=341454 RepID=A0A4S2N3N3_9PEZI|nr:dual specificity protein phosphatase 12 [Ascodesmis nigricans]
MFALRSKIAMKENEITHIVTVLRQPLDHTLFEGYEHLVIEVDDVEEENLIEHFARSYSWIDEAVKKGGRVFIHCAMGKSRSATVLCAYLMRSRKLGRDDALARIRETRPFVEPNPDFMKQLELYEKMGWVDDIDEHPIYQRWLWRRELELSRQAGVAPDRVHFRDAEKEMVAEAGMKEAQGERFVELRCKKCRRTLANSHFLTPHIPKASQPPHPRVPQQPCSHHFLEPLKWMKNELEQGKLEGKLDCPNSKCGGKVGSYAWQGMKCSCGEWVVPGISLARGRVDEVWVQGRL